MAIEPATEFALDGPAALRRGGSTARHGGTRPVAAGAPAPAAQPGRRGVRLACSWCSWWSAWRRRCGPTTWPTPTPLKNHLSDQIVVDGKKNDVVSPRRRADRARRGRASSSWAPTRNGRDTAVRLLYGGRNSLLIGIVRGADHDASLDHLRHPVGLLPRLHRHGDLTVDGRDLGLPGDPARRGARHGPHAVGLQHRAARRQRASPR